MEGACNTIPEKHRYTDLWTSLQTQLAARASANPILFIYREVSKLLRIDASTTVSTSEKLCIIHVSTKHLCDVKGSPLQLGYNASCMYLIRVAS